MGASIFIPVYNEEKTIKKNILEIYNVSKQLNTEFEIVIVDDGSEDNTPTICDNIGQEYSEIRYIHCEEGPSRRENLADSFKYAKHDIIIYMDSDIATKLDYLPALIDNIKYYDIILGSRYLHGSKITRRNSRLFISKIYNLFVRFYFGSKVTDHGCGFKAFKKNVILDLVKEAGHAKNLKRGWFWDAEILIRAQRKKYSILQIPVEWHFGGYSTFEVIKEMKMIPYILKFPFKLKK